MGLIKKRIFIVGSPRSGTTLLQNLLANQAYINTFPETHFFYTLCNRNKFLNKLNLLPRKEAHDLLINLAKEFNHSDNLDLKEFSIKKLFYSYWINQFVEILDLNTIQENKDVWIEKTPLHLHFIPIIEKTISDVHFIHIARNGLDVVASVSNYSKKHTKEWAGERSIDLCINRWQRDIQFSKENVSKPNHSFVLYEDLVSEKRAEILSSLLLNMELPYNPNFFNEVEKENFKRTVQDSEPWKRGVLNKIENTNGRIAQEVFTSEQIDYIQKLTKDTDLSFFR